MKSWLVLVAVALLGAGCDVGGGKLAGTGGGTLITGAGGAVVMTGSGGGVVIVTGGGGQGPINPCGAVFAAEPLRHDILIVLDTSASMNDGFDGPCAGPCSQSKWDAASRVLQSVVSSETSANWGLKL